MYLPRDYSYSQDIVEAFTDPTRKNDKGAKYTKLDFSLRPNVKAKDIRDHPEKYLMYLPFFSMNELPDLSPSEGSCYIKSASGPYDDEGKIDEEKKLAWLELFKMSDQFQAHCSGHASPDAIKEMIDVISPKIVIPVHTEHPCLFRKMKFRDLTKVKIIRSCKPFVIKQIDD
jgi:mRNA degradation ribonuclease J1/J2